MVIHRSLKGLDARCVRLGSLELIDARQVIDGREFLVQGRLQGVGAVQVLNEVADNLGFLVREVDQLVEILERGGGLHQAVHVPVDFLHGEAQLLESVDVPVDGAVGGFQFFGQLFDREIGVPGHKAHESEDSFYSGLFHMVEFYALSEGSKLSIFKSGEASGIASPSSSS